MRRTMLTRKFGAVFAIDDIEDRVLRNRVRRCYKALTQAEFAIILPWILGGFGLLAGLLFRSVGPGYVILIMATGYVCFSLVFKRFLGPCIEGLLDHAGEMCLDPANDEAVRIILEIDPAMTKVLDRIGSPIID